MINILFVLGSELIAELPELLDFVILTMPKGLNALHEKVRSTSASEIFDGQYEQL